jgi:hypothetical protein
MAARTHNNVLQVWLKCDLEAAIRAAASEISLDDDDLRARV